MSLSTGKITIKIKKQKNFLKKKKFNNYKLTDNQLEFFKKNGFIIIKNVINSTDTQEFKKEIWDTIYNIPFSQEIKDKIDFDFRDYDKDLTEKDIQNINTFYPNIDKFGTMNLPPFFHLNNMWKVRQNPEIFTKFAQLLKNHKIWCSLDRVSVKLPGNGNSEFCHWDSDPWYWEEQKFEPLQGILSLCDTSFFCCPGSHSLDFVEKFKKSYNYLKPTKGKREYVSLKKGANDPFNLSKSIKEYKLGPGDLIIFSNRLLHESKQNNSKKIRYVQYISFEPARNNQNNEIYSNNERKIQEKYRKSKIEEIDDRINSYLTGKNPIYLPSGCNMSIFSNNYLVFHTDLLNKFSNKFNKTILKKYKYKSGKNKGKEIYILYNYNSLDIFLENGEKLYNPFNLSYYGKRILGIKNW
jgi:ectoine hydroxylase-related dioxygenase (phytanoyl-CoA dioxygenase family)